ncbi:hypothetical protein FFLO_00441 [Filobasidium floriforme]|uniref:Uncharacterized protein n=1 Tax=Filobasidium floriforme TaxID=5210 RepID=A0A8K0JW97_9TREE|nr:uncharacterized protein HD553DRAFT_137143 [Filobasidium floriforme]KAG7575277.1 hypothetical protein FFLO_00441 [Filobasidium floriforme]KAH8078934.1 hypothetical protein HD553DRAFT_137143 [Filobasidium floriforme]
MLYFDQVIDQVLNHPNPWVLAVNGLAWFAIAWACDSELRIALVIGRYFRDDSRLKPHRLDDWDRDGAEDEIRRILNRIAAVIGAVIMAGSGLAWYHSRAGLFDGMFFAILSIQLALALDRIYGWSHPDTGLLPAGPADYHIGVFRTDEQGRPSIGWRDSPAIQLATVQILAAGLSAMLVLRTEADEHGLWTTLALLTNVVGAAGATDRKRPYEIRKWFLQILWGILGITGFIISLLIRGWWNDTRVDLSPVSRADAQKSSSQHLLGPAVLASFLQLSATSACVDVIIAQLAVLLRFDQARYDSEERYRLADEASSVARSQQSLEKAAQPEINLRRIPGYFESPRFLKPTYRAGLAGAALGSTCAMLIFPQRQATVFWVYLGAVGYVTFVAASLTLQGRWEDFWKYEERYIPEGTKMPQEAEKTEEQEKLIISA